MDWLHPFPVPSSQQGDIGTAHRVDLPRDAPHTGSDSPISRKPGRARPMPVGAETSTTEVEEDTEKDGHSGFGADDEFDTDDDLIDDQVPTLPWQLRDKGRQDLSYDETSLPVFFEAEEQILGDIDFTQTPIIDGDHDFMENNESYWRELDMCIGEWIGEEAHLTVPLLRFSRMTEAVGCGEIELGPDQVDNLNDEVHPIFGQVNWYRERRFGPDRINENDLLWQRMRPALRLATKFLTHPSTMLWLVRVLRGRVKRDKKTKKMVIEPKPYRGQVDLDLVQKRLLHLVGRVRWFFARRYVRPKSGMVQIHGSTWRNPRMADLHCDPDFAETGTLPESSIAIGLNIHFRNWLLSDQYDTARRPCQAMRSSWWMALVMAHEVIHALYASKSHRARFVEPYYEASEEGKELGRSWERHVFGRGDFECVVDSRFGALGMQWNPERVSKENKYVSVTSTIKYPLPTSYIAEFFQEDVWAGNTISDIRKQAWYRSPVEGDHAVARGCVSAEEPCLHWFWISRLNNLEHSRLSIRYWEDVDIRCLERKLGLVRQKELEMQEENRDWHPRKKRTEPHVNEI